MVCSRLNPIEWMTILNPPTTNSTRLLWWHDICMWDPCPLRSLWRIGLSIDLRIIRSIYTCWFHIISWEPELSPCNETTFYHKRRKSNLVKHHPHMYRLVSTRKVYHVFAPGSVDLSWHTVWRSELYRLVTCTHTHTHVLCGFVVLDWQSKPGGCVVKITAKMCVVQVNCEVCIVNQ